MGQSLRSKKQTIRGFSLIEVLVSIVILSIGLLSVAALIGSTMNLGTTARYMSMANTLASEKLDTLNKWPSSNANIAPGGSLSGASTCASGDTYCDQVTMNESSGANYETQTQIVNGNPVTTTIVQTRTGCVNTPTNCGVANPTGGSTFTRRWLITAPVTVTSAGGTIKTVGTAASGPRRITVLVILNNQQAGSPVSFQLSMVRP
jgi:type IV pilus modification protein PilV